MSRLCRKMNMPSLHFVQAMPCDDCSLITATRDFGCPCKPRVMQVLEKSRTEEVLVQSFEHVVNLHPKGV